MPEQTKQAIVHLNKALHCLRRYSNKEDCFHLGPISLEINKGELLGVIGPSGSGKTTLLRLIAGLEQTQEGSLSIDNVVVFNDQKFIEPEKRNVGMVFQEHALFPHLTVRKNILFGIKNWTKAEQEKQLSFLSELLGIAQYLDRYPHELSGGQQQRVAVGRSLAHKPKVILLDEPLSNIDADLRSSLAQELRNVIKRTGTTAIWVTHDQAEALDLADRIIVLNKGKIEQVDTPWNLYNNPKTRFIANFIGHAVFVEGESRGDKIHTEIGEVISLPCLIDTNKFEVMLRPDDVDAKADVNGKGKVYKRQFFGPIQTYTIALPSGDHILTNQAAKVNWEIGTKVAVSLKIQSAVAFPIEKSTNK